MFCDSFTTSESLPKHVEKDADYHNRSDHEYMMIEFDLNLLRHFQSHGTR